MAWSQGSAEWLRSRSETHGMIMASANKSCRVLESTQATNPQQFKKPASIIERLKWHISELRCRDVIEMRARRQETSTQQVNSSAQLRRVYVPPIAAVESIICSYELASLWEVPHKKWAHFASSDWSALSVTSQATIFITTKSPPCGSHDVLWRHTTFTQRWQSYACATIHTLTIVVF